MRLGWFGGCGWLMVLGTAVGAGCGDECDFDAQTRELGEGAIYDCGVGSLERPEDVDACALEQDSADRLFRAIYETEDGGLLALVRGEGGTYYELRTDAEGQRIEQRECGGVELREDDGRRHLLCASPEATHTVCE